MGDRTEGVYGLELAIFERNGFEDMLLMGDGFMCIVGGILTDSLKTGEGISSFCI